MIEQLVAPRLPATPASPGRPVWVSLPAPEAPLFQGHGVLVTSEHVVARGKRLLLADVTRVESVRHSPRMAPVLATLALAVSVGLPLLSALSVSSSAAIEGRYEAALGVTALVIFASIARLVLAEDSYQVLAHTKAGAWRVHTGRESRDSTELATLLDEAATRARGRH
ncbi:hypothetical protein HPC49_04670 [Pyxidicoccus fallax]|uniref:Uncharacterized protein n=1 Tax=Pyxidicoccus fallax TaxID=394095 RepID=A0A848LJU7_9BACT|nr:DUF6232 family protein [Pyxidicoccus fallax]NMO17983.1 hypothetical protein [Pyxidicoccus fallax]NPC77544.1 hypothetical protein [Pyxidicoccus fallax]